MLTLRRHGAPLLAITDMIGGNVREIPPSLTAGSISVEHAEDYDRGSVIIAEQSLIEPPTWYELDLGTGSEAAAQADGGPRSRFGAVPDRATTAPAPDGTPIPVTLAYGEGTSLDGSAPCLLYGYGAYEEVLDPEFDREPAFAARPRSRLRDRSHPRWRRMRTVPGGTQGRLRAKPTTFTDYIDVADWLAGRLVDGSRIVSRGLSAGGLLQGAVYSMRPDRWRAVVAEVPFVDS